METKKNVMYAYQLITVLLTSSFHIYSN